MKEMFGKQGVRFKDESGFTLIEILIVVILLGILATIIIPQVSVSTSDAKLSSVKSNLASLRNSVELYYFQHNDTWPGQNDITGSGTSVAGTAATAFLQQLTRYTEADGTVSDTKTADAKYGPYIKGGNLPTNPYNDKNDVTADATETNITTKTSGGNTAWKFYTQTGVVMANDGANDSL